jgi:hypothetical protein
VIGPNVTGQSGDVIVDSGAVAVVDQQPVFNLELATQAQTDLSALFIANIVGRAQTAFNINIAAATLNIIPDPGTPFATPIGSTGPGTIKQINAGVQFRGTPLGVGNTTFNLQQLNSPN